MSLTEQLRELNAGAVERFPPEVIQTMVGATTKLKESGVENRALKEGDTAPDFMLPDHKGGTAALSEMLAKGPLVISFYRGEWCPYCNLEVKALQDSLPELEDLGASLVAVSPETPDHTLSMAEKHDLSFDVLSDTGNQVARQFGLVFTLAEELRPIYDNFGIDVPKHNGDDTFELPIPATYVIGTDGKIIKAYVDANYATRLDPADILASLRGD